MAGASPRSQDPNRGPSERPCEHSRIQLHTSQRNGAALQLFGSERWVLHPTASRKGQFLRKTATGRLADRACKCQPCDKRRKRPTAYWPIGPCGGDAGGNGIVGPLEQAPTGRAVSTVARHHEPSWRANIVTCLRRGPSLPTRGRAWRA